MQGQCELLLRKQAPHDRGAESIMIAGVQNEMEGVGGRGSEGARTEKFSRQRLDDVCEGCSWDKSTNLSERVWQELLRLGP
jgi:hypothetical protein